LKAIPKGLARPGLARFPAPGAGDDPGWRRTCRLNVWVVEPRKLNDIPIWGTAFEGRLFPIGR
jgi:hypothetical protein